MEQKRPADIFQEALDYLWNGLGLEEKGWKRLKKDIIKSYITDFSIDIVGNFIKTTGKDKLNLLTKNEADKVIEYLKSNEFGEAMEMKAKNQ